MLKKTVLLTAAGVLVLAGAQTAFAQFGSLANVTGGASNLVGGGSSGGSMKQNAQQFAVYMNTGTYHLATAVARMEQAVGHADIAKELTAQAEVIKKAGASATSEDYAKTYALVDKSNISRDELSKVPESKGRVELTQSSLHFGIGALEDKKAVDMARALATSRPSAQDALDGSVMTAINVARVAVDVLPGHIEKTGTWMGNLSDYFSSHKISPPSQEEKKKVAAEDLPADQANALFAN